MKNNNPSKSVPLTYEETTFNGLADIVGISTFKNWSILWAFLITFWVVGFTYHHGSLQSDLILLSISLTSTLLGASAGIFGIVIASLTISLTLFHQSLLPFMLEKKLLHKFLFPFWFAIGSWAVSIVLCIILNVFHILKLNDFIVNLFIFELFTFLFSTFYTVSLTGLVIRLALQRAQIKD
jgi:hypothetical protein